MRFLIIPRSLRTVVVASALLTAVAAIYTVRDQPDRLFLVGVPTRTYDGSEGIELRGATSSPDGELISADEAAHRAANVNGYRGGSVRQVVLAREINTNSEPETENLVWVVNFDPTTVAWHRWAGCGIGCGGIEDQKMETTYALLFLDAETGEAAGELMSGCRRLGLEDLGVLLNPRQHIFDPCP